MFKKIFLASLGLTLVVAACKKTDEDYSAKSYEYYPYAVKNERIYRLDSVLYGIDTTLKTKRIILEVVTEKFADQQGQEAYRLEQYTLPDSGKNQVFFDLQSTNWNGQGVQRVENNQRYLKMVFPIRDKRQWNGNMFNNIGQLMYQYTGTFKPVVYNNVTYPDAVIVTQQSEINSLIGTHEDIEVYAKNVGLVYRLNRHLELSDPNNPNSKKIGYEAIWTLTKFRK